MRLLSACLLLLSCCFIAHADTVCVGQGDSLAAVMKEQVFIVITDTNNNYFAIDSASPQVHENKRAIAAVLAFPFPFGILGLHRIYLGTKPYMPFVYLGTLGGCLGILPLIDFITILTSKGETLKAFENNPKVFMWSR